MALSIPLSQSFLIGLKNAWKPKRLATVNEMSCSVRCSGEFGIHVSRPLVDVGFPGVPVVFSLRREIPRDVNRWTVKQFRVEGDAFAKTIFFLKYVKTINLF